MRTHRRASNPRTPALDISIDPPTSDADDLPMTTLPDTGLQPIIEDVVLVADEVEDYEVTRPHPRPTLPMAVLCDPPRH